MYRFYACTEVVDKRTLRAKEIEVAKAKIGGPRGDNIAWRCVGVYKFVREMDKEEEIPRSWISGKAILCGNDIISIPEPVRQET